ncbi:MAG TPA: hypothetical protein VK578_02450 [Edaphobacter sp.]|nr:hypothetical protein [Edaphobacter sp.]
MFVAEVILKSCTSTRLMDAMGSIQQVPKEICCKVRGLPEHSGGAAQEGEAEMTCLNTHRIPESGQGEYATAEDFRELFTEDPNGFYMLSFLLTANHEKAKQCFVAGLDDCVDGNAVFQEWAGRWARRVIVRNAIRILAPHKGEPKPTEIADQPAGKRRVLEMPVQDVPFASVLRLNEFERFVYVLSVIERFGDHECAVLLGISLKEMREARAIAVKHVSDLERAVSKSAMDHSGTS